MAELEGVNLPFVPIGGVDALRSPAAKPTVKTKSLFEELLENEISNLKFSGHAKSRLISKNIDITASEIVRLVNAVDKAAAKGARDSLIMLDDKAFIVSVQNRTVVTMMQKGQMEDNVITNIDSAVFA
ncbi:MAG TPA: TIGR02530 family flagellar biosynthesis protein [Candidatus Kapabacteria bacterium]|nr:TIGR02530 family flagellar biosynthesis protein [Candidatus Kapabacteria bacterium]